MNDRPTASTINDQQLDELHERAEQAEAEAKRWLAFIERGMNTHMQFGVINPDGSTEQLPCADWCYACRVEKADAAIARVRTACDQLHCAVLNVNGEPLSLYDRGVDTAVRRIRSALGAPVPGPASAQATKEQPMPVCTATIEGPHVLGGGPVQCTREAGHPENHVGPKQGSAGRTLWTDHNAGTTPHQASSEEQPS